MKKFFNGLLVVFLLVIIIGGIGYIGYSYLFMNHSGMAMTADQSQNTNSGHTSMQPQQSSQHGNMNMNNSQSGDQQNSNPIVTEQVNIALQNRENLGKSIMILNEAIGLMTLDPYSPSETSKDTDSMDGMGGMQGIQPQQGNGQTNNTQAASAQGNTTINIYPPSNNGTNNMQTSPAVTDGSTMMNMGAAYDANKMEQLHSGLYKLSVGMQLLNQLNGELISQAELAAVGSDNPVQYFSNQYTNTVQYKNKLSQALTYINDAAGLVNINPYVSKDGLIYDKNRMQSIHQSIFKLAEGVASLNKLGDDLTKQAIENANKMQAYTSNNTSAAAVNYSSMPTGLFGGMFANIQASSLVNILLVVFIIAFILGILGFIFSLMKKPRDNIRQS